jgi:hypothetical protein
MLCGTARGWCARREHDGSVLSVQGCPALGGGKSASQCLRAVRGGGSVPIVWTDHGVPSFWVTYWNHARAQIFIFQALIF